MASLSAHLREAGDHGAAGVSPRVPSLPRRAARRNAARRRIVGRRTQALFAAGRARAVVGDADSAARRRARPGAGGSAAPDQAAVTDPAAIPTSTRAANRPTCRSTPARHRSPGSPLSPTTTKPTRSSRSRRPTRTRPSPTPVTGRALSAAASNTHPGSRDDPARSAHARGDAEPAAAPHASGRAARYHAGPDGARGRCRSARARRHAHAFTPKQRRRPVGECAGSPRPRRNPSPSRATRARQRRSTSRQEPSTAPAARRCGRPRGAARRPRARRPRGRVAVVDRQRRAGRRRLSREDRTRSQPAVGAQQRPNRHRRPRPADGRHEARHCDERGISADPRPPRRPSRAARRRATGARRTPPGGCVAGCSGCSSPAASARRPRSSSGSDASRASRGRTRSRSDQPERRRRQDDEHLRRGQPARQPPQLRAIAVDANPDFGTLARWRPTSRRSERSLADLLDDADRLKHCGRAQPYVSRLPTGLHVLGAPRDAELTAGSPRPLRRARRVPAHLLRGRPARSRHRRRGPARPVRHRPRRPARARHHTGMGHLDHRARGARAPAARANDRRAQQVLPALRGRAGDRGPLPRRALHRAVTIPYDEQLATMLDSGTYTLDALERPNAARDQAARARRRRIAADVLRRGATFGARSSLTVGAMPISSANNPDPNATPLAGQHLPPPDSASETLEPRGTAPPRITIQRGHDRRSQASRRAKHGAGRSACGPTRNTA